MVSDAEWDACLDDLRIAGGRLSELREELLTVRAERDALRATVAGLRESLEWIQDAAKDMQDGKESAGMALIRIEDFAAYSLGLAATPAPDGRDTNDG